MKAAFPIVFLALSSFGCGFALAVYKYRRYMWRKLLCRYCTAKAYYCSWPF